MRKSDQYIRGTQLAFDFSPPKNLLLLTVTEIYNSANRALFEGLKEDQRIERKPVGVHCPFLGEYFSMWANTKPDGGIIVIGQEDNGAMCGCVKAGADKINKLEQVGITYCPDAKYEMTRVDIKLPDGTPDFIIMFRIFYREDKLVRTVRGEAFVRRGDQKKKLTEAEAREIEIDKKQTDFEQEQTRLEYPQDFDTGLITQFVQAYKENRQLDSNHTAENILEITHLGKS